MSSQDRNFQTLKFGRLMSQITASINVNDANTDIQSSRIAIHLPKNGGALFSTEKT